MGGAGRVFWIAGAGAVAIGGACWLRAQGLDPGPAARPAAAAAPAPHPGHSDAAARELRARIAMLREAAARSPGAVSPRLLLARTYQQSGQRERAAEQFEAAIR